MFEDADCGIVQFNKPYGDYCAILKPANEYGEELQEKRVVIPVEIVGLTLEDLANAVYNCRDREIQDVWDYFVNELNNAAQGLLAMEDDGSVNVWFKEEVKYERIRDYLQRKRSELIREFTMWYLKWCNTEGDCMEIPGATTQKQIEAAGNPALWITYGGVCFSAAAGCIAATRGLDVPDAIGSAIACGLPAAMGWMQSPLLELSWQGVGGGIGGAGIGALAGTALTRIGAWHGSAKLTTRREWMKLVGARRLGSFAPVSPLKVLLKQSAESSEVLKNLLISALKELKNELTQVGNKTTLTAEETKKKKALEKALESIKKAYNVQNLDDLDNIAKSMVNNIDNIPEEALVEIFRKLNSTAITNALQKIKNTDPKTLELIKKVYKFEGDDLTEPAKKIVNEHDTLRRINVLRLFRGKWGKIAAELGKQLALGVACDIAGVVTGTLIASGIYEATTHIDMLEIHQEDGRFLVISYDGKISL